MKDKVRIKSFSNGLTIQLDENVEFEELVKEISQKFREGKAFFGNAAVAISFHGRQLTQEEEQQLLTCIESNCRLKIVCVVSSDREQENRFGRAMQLYEHRRMAESDPENEIQVFRGSLRDGEELDTPNNIIILGDVEYGCSVTSEKSILVLGGLYGKAHAGKSENAKVSIVVALEMAPSELLIGDFKYVPTKKSRWGKKQESDCLVARVSENTILMEKFTKEHLKDF